MAGLPARAGRPGLGYLYAVELTPGLLWPLMEGCERRGISFYPFTGAGDSRSEGLVAAPPLDSSGEDIDFLTAALTDASRRPPLARPALFLLRGRAVSNQRPGTCNFPSRSSTQLDDPSPARRVGDALVHQAMVGDSLVRLQDQIIAPDRALNRWIRR